MINRKKFSNRAAYIVLALIFAAIVLTTALEVLIGSADMKIIDISQSSGDNEVELICLLTEDYRDSRSGFIYDSGTLMTVYIDSEKFFKRELGINQNVRFYTTKTVEEPMEFTRFRAFGLKKISSEASSYYDEIFDVYSNHDLSLKAASDRSAVIISEEKSINVDEINRFYTCFKEGAGSYIKIFADGGDTENTPKSSWLIYSNGKIIFVTDNYKYYGTEPISIYKYCWFDETQSSMYLYNSEEQNDMLKIF